MPDDWRQTLERVARRAGLAFGDAKNVRALSDAYNAGGARAPRALGPDVSLSARISFFFLRDMPKATAAVRELPLRSPLRLLDLGAGLGAATWGIARALGEGRVDATLVDDDERALELARAIAKEKENREGDVEIGIETIASDANTFEGGSFDLAIAQNVLAEIEAAPDADADRLSRWLSFVKEDGSLVIVEPALKNRTRHLHEVRDRLAARGLTIFAPCLHARPCPLLARPGDWCHEDLPIDLPDWLAPVARDAGLRWQGLTFSYLVVRRDQTTLASRLPPHALRAVSSLVVTKGKKELELCGARAFLDARRLDRDESPTNQAWGAIRRGELLTLEPPFDSSGPVRVGRDCRVTRLMAVDDGRPRR